MWKDRLVLTKLPHSAKELFLMKTPQSFSTHKKTSIILSFHSDLELRQTAVCQVFSRWKFWRKLLSSFCQLSWKINDCLSRSMPGLPPGCFGWDQLEDCSPTRHCHKAPLWFLLDSSRGPARRETKLGKVETVVQIHIQPFLLLLTMTTLRKLLCFHEIL